MARSRAADARTLAAQGLFDMVFDAEVQARPLGYYDNALADVKLTRPLATNGGQVYGGYRVSAGRFAGYDGKSVTNGLGEVRAARCFRCCAIAMSTNGGPSWRRPRPMEIAGLDQAMVAIGVQRRAADAYQQWVAAGLRMRTYRDLLALARERQASIERQVQLGARPAVLAVENRQNIVRREALLVRSEQDLAVAAQALSLFWRDDLGQPIVATADDLPASFPDGVAPRLADTATVLANRPDLQILMNRAEQARLRGDLAGNDLLPKLDVRVEASKDFGSGSYTRVPGEVLFGVRLSMPLEQRGAWPHGRGAGRCRCAEPSPAPGRAADHRRSRQPARAGQRRRAAGRACRRRSATGRRMAEAERRRFALGASDFLPVNLREEAAADAQLRQIDAQYRHAAARAELAASLMDGTSLGLP
jgi:hypothetical protein